MNPLWTVCTHTYLLSASVLLACLLVTQSTSVFPNILLLLILAGHLFLLVKFGTVQYLMNLIDSLHSIVFAYRRGQNSDAAACPLS